MSSKVNWQPINKLPVFFDIINGMYQNTIDSHNLISQAKDKPHVMDDNTITRIFKVNRQQLKDIRDYEEQLTRWKRIQMTDEQSQQIEELSVILGKAKELTEEILEIADYLKDNTIEKIMNKPDGELAIEVMLGMRKL